MPNALKIRLPAAANTQSTIAQVQAERLAICRRVDSGTSNVIDRNIGTTAKGSTRKKIEVAASSTNSRTSVASRDLPLPRAFVLRRLG